MGTGHRIESSNFLSLMEQVCPSCQHLTGLHCDSNMDVVEDLIASIGHLQSGTSYNLPCNEYALTVSVATKLFVKCAFCSGFSDIGHL